MRQGLRPVEERCALGWRPNEFGIGNAEGGIKSLSWRKALRGLRLKVGGEKTNALGLRFEVRGRRYAD